MNCIARLLLPAMTLSLASCALSPRANVALTPPLTGSQGNSPMHSGTEPYVPCSALTVGRVSRQDTAETLAWVLALRAVIVDICGGNE